MPKIIPIKDLKNTSAIAQMCEEAKEPIYITRNGYGAMVIMSVAMYEERMHMLDVYARLEAAEAQFAAGEAMDADESLRAIRAEFDV
ncbi:MAG: type II toxin-antitoxin system Phd/YefM family antitoxin [Eubacteriaceae bacterium]|nr:type II toxin-antitoxin system Phd/YefM family antitoxin [Eubacteriaceae bacterium]